MLLVSLLASTCLAADWYWVYSTSEATHYIDKNSGYWNDLHLTCTLKQVYVNGDYMLGNVTYDYSKYPQIYKRLNKIWSYNADGSYRGSEKSYEWEWDLIAPESVGEVIAMKAFALFNNRR